jgi:hypothetical protein
VVGFYILFLAWHGIKFYVWKREKYNRKRTSLGGSNTSQGQSYEMDESLRTQTEDPTGQSVNQLGNVTAERGANRLQPTISLTLSQQISEIQATNPHSVPDRYRATRAADRREQHRKTSRLAEAISEGRGTQNQQNTATGAIQGTDPNQQEDTERTGFSAWIQKFYLIKFLIFVRNFANAHWKNELYLLIWVFTFLATLGEFIHLAVSRRGVGLLWLVWVVLCIAFVLRLTSGLMQRFRRYYAPACSMWLALCIIYIIRILTTVFEAGGQWNNWSGLFQDDGMKPGSHKVEDTVPWILFSIFMFIFLALAETQRCDEGKMDEDKEVDG